MHSCYILEANPFSRFPIHNGETSHLQLVLWKAAQGPSNFGQGNTLERLFAVFWEIAQPRETAQLSLPNTTKVPTKALVFHRFSLWRKFPDGWLTQTLFIHMLGRDRINLQ